MTRALVLAGGGLAGIAWETGVLLGLRDAGVDLTAPDLVVGTSAGSAVGAALLSGTDLEELFARQVAQEHHELTPEMDLQALIAFFTEVGDFTKGVDEATRRTVGAYAREATTVSLEARQEVMRWRLPSHDWPSTPLRLTAVDTETGALVVLDAASGVPLIDAVAASCAVPGVWPCVPLLGRLLMDGGVRSTTNLDLAEGYDDVVTLAPLTIGAMEQVVQTEADRLRAQGATVRVICADEASAAAFGPNPLDPASRPAAAEAGRVQGRAAAQLF
ncbi:MAG: patatin [Frankiales bacterium]|nr:patatin [Frankiales bacterium]